MVDNTMQRGAGDRARVAGGQEHEVRYFANKHGITVEQAQQLIAEHGNNREALEAAVQQMKG
jgi:Protein of unknown function (DUF3606)